MKTKNDLINKSCYEVQNLKQMFQVKDVVTYENPMELSRKFSEVFYNKLVLLGVPENEVSNYDALLCGFLKWVFEDTYITPSLNENASDADINFYNYLMELDPSKGFYLYGNTGVGKTTFLDAITLALAETRLFKFNSHSVREIDFCPIKVSAGEILRIHQSYGYEGKRDYGSFKPGINTLMSPGDPYNEFHEPCTRYDNMKTFGQLPIMDRFGSLYTCYPVLYIDDFMWGNTGEQSSYFGNKTNVLEEIVKTRCDNDLITFITSNVKPGSMSDATIDRMRENFNVICFDRTESFRK